MSDTPRPDPVPPPPEPDPVQPVQPGQPVQPVQPTMATAVKDNTQLFGILGIVLAVICCPPLGILFGYLSMKEAKKLGKDDTLGKVGFWLGIAMTALSVIGTIFALCFGWFGSNNWDNDRYDY